MSPEFYSIIGTGLVLAGLIMPKLNAMGTELRERMAHRGNYSQPRIGLVLLFLPFRVKVSEFDEFANYLVFTR